MSMPRRIQKRRGGHFREAEGIFEKKWLALDSLDDARLRNGAWSIPERPGFRGPGHSAFPSGGRASELTVVHKTVAEPH